MSKALTKRIEALEAQRASAQAGNAGDWSIPMHFFDEDGNVVGTMPARLLPPRDAMGIRVFDHAMLIADLVQAHSYYLEEPEHVQ